MTDEEILQTMGGLRPAAPPPGLRARIVGVHRPARTWPWVAAAAALLVSILGLRSVTAHIYAEARSAVVPASRAAEATAARAALGDDAWIIDETLWRSTVALPAPQEVEAR